MSPTGNASFDATLIAATGTLQQAIAVAGSQADATAAAIAFYRSLYAAGIANSIDVGDFLGALADLGATV